LHEIDAARGHSDRRSSVDPAISRGTVCADAAGSSTGNSGPRRITAPTHLIECAVITHQIDRTLEKCVDVSLEHVRIGDAMKELL
jgi:hypothetical protein